MPAFNDRALLFQLTSLPEFLIFLEDFHRVAGLHLHILDGLGRSATPPRGLTASTPIHQWQSLLSRAREGGTVLHCGPDWLDAAVCIEVLGRTPAYVFLRAARVTRPGPEADARTPSSPPAMTAEKFAACARWVAMARDGWVQALLARLAEPRGTIPASVRKAQQAIRNTAMVEDLDVAGISSACGTSPSHLSRLFRHHTGFTIGQFISHCRVKHALHLLRTTDHSVTEVAFASGFQSISQFHRVFRKFHGCTPRQARSTAELPGPAASPIP